MVVEIAQEITPPKRLDAPAYDVMDLTKGGDTATLVLNEQPYTLRITRSGKLILTK